MKEVDYDLNLIFIKNQLDQSEVILQAIDTRDDILW